jgi:hypothetical protein
MIGLGDIADTDPREVREPRGERGDFELRELNFADIIYYENIKIFFFF